MPKDYIPNIPPSKEPDLLALAILPLTASIALADTGVVESINHDGVTGLVLDELRGHIRFVDDTFPDSGIEEGDTVNYQVVVNKAGAYATNLELAELEPTLRVDGNYRGSLYVRQGDLCVLSGVVSHDVVVTGGTLVFEQGAEIGRDLEVNGGEVQADGGTVRRDILISSGDLEMNDNAQLTTHRNIEISGGNFEMNDNAQISMGRDILVTGGDVTLNDSSTFIVDRDLSINGGDFNLSQGSAVDVGRNIDLNSGDDTVVNGTLTAGGDVGIDAGASLILSGSVSAAGDVNLSGESLRLAGAVSGDNVGLGGGTCQTSGPIRALEETTIVCSGWMSRSTLDVGTGSLTLSSERDTTLSGTVRWGDGPYRDGSVPWEWTGSRQALSGGTEIVFGQSSETWTVRDSSGF